MTEIDTVPSAHERLLELVGDGTLICEADGRVSWANRAALDVLGIADGLRGSRLACWFSDGTRISRLLLDCLNGEGPGRPVVATAVGSGSDVLAIAHPGETRGTALVILRPLQNALSSFDRAISFATRDPVTRLLNRDAFQERLAAKMRSSAAGVLICANINQFPTINEVYGISAGDGLLRAVAQRLRSAAPNDSCLARIYGGRFALFVPALDLAEARAAGGKLADSLNEPLAEPIPVAGGAQPVNLSIGLAVWPDDGATAEELISAAEGAIGALTRQGGGGTRWFEPAMRIERRRFLEIEAELRNALVLDELVLYYQPKVRWSDRGLVGFEGLIRWNHPERGLVSPGQFIPVAEQSNLIIDIGHWVMRAVCRQQAEWRAQGLEIVPIAVNISPKQLLAQPIEALLAPVVAHGLPLECLEIEITETAMMDKLPTAYGVIESLRRTGIHVSIDDFGTGHSSLGNLRRLPIDVLKIDRSFVEDIEESPEAYDIVATIVAMARTLSLDVVAEGVETERQAALLRSHGVDVMQGYLFAKPMPAAAAASLLKPHMA